MAKSFFKWTDLSELAAVTVTYENDTAANPPNRPGSRGWKKSNKVGIAPPGDKGQCQIEIECKTECQDESEATKIEIPPENVVTCDVVVHREKTPSISSPRGVDNPAFVEDNGEAPQKDVNETPVWMLTGSRDSRT